jgi:hypothetical protein
MRRRAFAVAGMLTLGMALPGSAASADPILITGGTLIAAPAIGGILGTLDVQGTRGFNLTGRLDLSNTTGPWECRFSCPPGTSLDLSGFLSSGDGSGIVQLGGATYVAPVHQADFFLRPVAGPVTLPPLSPDIVSLSAPFELGLSELLLYDVGGEPTLTFALIGRGTATIELRPDQIGESAWELVQVRYEFSPVEPIPEPASLLLLGGGMFALAAKRHRRR